jgi:hypothetical protein
MSAWAADFNRDGFHDYLIFNPSTRQTADWYLNGKYQFIGGGFGPTLPKGWNLVSVADFNRDGHPDYLLFNPSTHKNAIWYLNRGRFVSAAYVDVNAVAGWTPITTTDFNLNGSPDIVVYNQATRQTAIWNLVNTHFLDEGRGPTLAPGFLLISAQGDFNADGKPDYLLFNPVTGQTAMWFLNGRSYAGGVFGPKAPKGYAVEELADFNHDGRPDYLLNLDRVTALWFLRGNIFLGSAYGPTLTKGWSHALGAARPCSLSISPTSVACSADAQTGNVYVSTSNFGCVWSVVSNAAWLHITKGGTVGSSYASYAVDKNSTGAARAGTLTFASGLSAIIRQDANVPCGSTQVAGGDTPVTRTVELGRSSGTFNFSYNTYQIADRIVVTYQGKTLFDTSCVGTSGSVNLTYAGTATSVTVSVTPNCSGGGSSTQWTFTVGCPQ